MDPQKLVEILQGTIHPELRETAEKQLDEVSIFCAIMSPQATRVTCQMNRE